MRLKGRIRGAQILQQISVRLLTLFDQLGQIPHFATEGWGPGLTNFLGGSPKFGSIGPRPLQVLGCSPLAVANYGIFLIYIYDRSSCDEN